MQIEIDFEVFKALTALRQHEGDTYNHVIRRILKLPAPDAMPVNALLGGVKLNDVAEAVMQRPATINALARFSDGAWFNGVFFPNGTKLRANYKGQTFFAQIKDGHWIDSNGIVRTSPSDAANAISGTNVNGWRFWHAQGPADSTWRRLDEFQ